MGPERDKAGRGTYDHPPDGSQGPPICPRRDLGRSSESRARGPLICGSLPRSGARTLLAEDSPAHIPEVLVHQV